MPADLGLDQLSREELVERARGLGARRPEVMTRVELRDEIVRLSEPDPSERRRSRGWLGVARDLVASVMDAGLNMPEAAARVRGEARAAEETTGPPPVATLTLAEIYLAQGHADRALAVLEEVLTAEPEHAAALALRARIAEEQVSGAARRRGPALAEDPYISSPLTSDPGPEAVRSPELVTDPPAPLPSVPPRSDLTPPPPLAAPAPFAPARALEPLPAVHSAVDPLAVTAAVPIPGGAAGAAGAAPAVPDRRTEPPSEAPPPPDSAPWSAPIPTLAAPSATRGAVADAPAPAAPAPVAPAPVAPAAPAPVCALAQLDSGVEGLYALPPGTTGTVLRVAWFVPGPDGPTEGKLDVALEPGKSRVALPAAPRAAHVRAALGVNKGGAFRPLAIAWVYRVSEGRVSVAFAAPGPEPVALRAQLAPAASDQPV